MIVVDTNIISYFYLESDYSKKVEAAFNIDNVWVAPVLWRSEFRNVLSYYMRKNIINLFEANNIMNSALQMMEGGEYQVVSSEILNLCGSSNCSAYDCEFVALANELGVKLITVDKKILKNFPETAVSLNDFGE